MRPSMVLFLAFSLLVSGTRGDDKLLAVWHFDEAKGDYALDASGSENDATISGAKRVPGLFGGALEFNGADSHGTAPGLGELPEGSVEAWVNLAAPCTGQAGPVVFGRPFREKSDLGILGFCDTGPDHKPGTWVFAIYGGDRWNCAASDIKPELNQWYHLVGTWDRTGMALFVNGKPAGRSDAWKGGMPAHDAVLLGAGSWGSVIKGAVDEVRIQGRVLTADEVAAHFADRGYVTAPPQPDRRVLHRTVVKTVSVADFADESSLTGGIQEAINALPRGGGTVSIPAGTYVTRRTVHVPGNVTLAGAGVATVLTRPPQVMSKLVRTTGPGGREVEIADASGFETGCGVSICDKKMGGWYGTDAEIEAIRGNVLVLSRDLEKEYSTEREAVAINFFPIVAAHNVRHVTIRDLCIDGRRKESPGPWSDFVWAAIHFVSCSDSRIEACTVRDYISDGIGVQSGTGNIVRGCICLNCHGHGFHPGTSLQDSVFDGNTGRGNDWDGLYFCADVRHIVVSNSVFTGNGWSGIGGLGEGGDKYNVVTGNTCSYNGHCGIAAIGGTDNVVTGNVCLGNSTSKPGAWPGISLSNVTDVVVSSNRCTDDQAAPTQHVGIEESGNSDYNLISANNCRISKVKGIKVVGAHTVTEGNLE